MSSFYGYIYLTTNAISNRKYIGRRKGSFTEKYLGSGIALKDAIKKYGEEAFTVQPIFYAFSDEDLNNAEKTIIAYYNASVNEEFYNIAVGGNCWGSSHTKETKNKIRLKAIGRTAFNKGVPNPEASKRMTENNPMKNPEIAKKVSETLRMKFANEEKQLSFRFSFSKYGKDGRKKTLWTYPDGTTQIITDTRKECERLGLSYSAVRHKIGKGPYVSGKHKGLSIDRLD